MGLLQVSAGVALATKGEASSAATLKASGATTDPLRAGDFAGGVR
jgi:hypothetical protein